MLDDCDERAAEIAAMPSTGAPGLAVKVFFAVRADGARRGRRDAAIGAFSDDDRQYRSTWIIESVIRDAVRFAPELAPLCAEIIGEAGEPEEAAVP